MQMRNAGMIVLALAAGQVGAEEAASFKSALSETKYILDARLRSEDVEQDGVANDANATTLRARLGFETGKLWNTSLLVEGEAVVPLDTDYRPDPMVPEMVTYPVVADPESYAINRLQLVNTSIPGTTLTLGRQRITLEVLEDSAAAITAGHRHVLLDERTHRDLVVCIERIELDRRTAGRRA